MLTREQIVKIVGSERLHDHQVVEIVETGANEAELVEAFERCVRPGGVGEEVQRAPSQTVNALCKILSIEKELPDEEARQETPE